MLCHASLVVGKGKYLLGISTLPITCHMLFYCWDHTGRGMGLSDRTGNRRYVETWPLASGRKAPEGGS